MKAKYYYRFIISELPREYEELVSSFCFNYGAEGVSENLEFEQLDREYKINTIEKPIKTIEAYFSSEPDHLELTQRIKSIHSSIQTKLTKEQVIDWMSEWKKDFKPFELTHNIWVVPSWLTAPENSDFNIYIDPGMAFGTGTHATTQIAADLLIYLKSINPNLNSLIDVGTGTGILAILAKHLGYKKIAATEIDEDARGVGIENCLINKADIEVYPYQIEVVKNNFEVVVANIIDGVLVRIQNDLKRCCSKYLLLTGILDEREKLFLKDFERNNFKTIKRLQKQEWIGFLLERQ